MTAFEGQIALSILAVVATAGWALDAWLEERRHLRALDASELAYEMDNGSAFEPKESA